MNRLKLAKLLLMSVAVVMFTACGGGGSGTGGQTKTDVIKKTGQTKSYDASGNEVTDNSLKDDGFYQKGITPSYTRDDANEIVTDHVTELMWQDDADAASVIKPWLTPANYSTCSTDTASSACEDTSGDTAATYCTTLTLGGYSDWRLPTLTELENIVDYGENLPAIDKIYFNQVVFGDYWSSTTVEGNKFHAWIVNFSGGAVLDGDVKGANIRVRCVRDGE